MRSPIVACLLFMILTAEAQAQETPVPPGDPNPVLRLEPEGPAAYVTALAFSPDGKTLYAAGYDKVVRIWNLNTNVQPPRFVPDEFAFRVPIGPGTDGALNALAVSPDGTWLAAGGLGVIRGGSGFREPGRVFPSAGTLTPEMRRDRGLIYLFDTKTRAVRVLRGHEGTVLALAFAPAHEGKPALVVSAALERDDQIDDPPCVVRLWDVDRGTVLAETKLPPTRTQVSLDSRHTGNEPKQVRVAIGWGDGAFRVWDVERNQLLKEEFEKGAGLYYSPIAYLGDAVLVSAFTQNSGQIQAWSDPAEGRPRRKDQAKSFPADGEDFFRPRALAPVSSRSNGTFDHFAVVLGRSKVEKNRLLPAYQYDLRLVDAAGMRTAADITLWKGDSKAPTIATSPRGTHLAVAGNKRHEILVYSVPDLLRNNARPMALRSVGATMLSVAFVTKGQQVALALGEADKGGPGRPVPFKDLDHVFDFAKRSLTRNPAGQGWELSSPALDGWQVKRRDGKPAGDKVRWPFTWEGPGDSGQVEIEVTTTDDVTDYAILPPLKPVTIPILAVATWDRKLSQPGLTLYAAKSSGSTKAGEPIRQFKGHVAQIRCLAPSRDGKLLASAAEDQTVCLWSLTDLGSHLGQHGALPGVAVKVDENAAGKPIVLSKPDKSIPANEKLEDGDVLKRVLVKPADKPLMYASAREFYDAVWELKPGTRLSLQLDRKEPVELSVGQAVDDRKPLLSLFVVGDGAQPRGWLAWSPHGPYDSSGEQIERYLGCHFNTGEAKGPASFALSKQYRKRFYRPGILQPLVTHGDISKAIQDRVPPEVPQPDMTLWIQELGLDPEKIDPRAPVLLREPKATLRVEIDGPSFEEEQIASVVWQLNQDEPRSFKLDEATGQSFSKALDLPKTSGVHKVRVTLQTREVNPRVCTRELTVRYQPPAPHVEPDKDWLKKHFGEAKELRKVVQEGKFPVKSSVRGAAGQGVKVTLWQNGKQVALPQGNDVDQMLTLEPGQSVIELRAENEKALKGYEEFETARLTMLVIFQQKNAPHIVLQKLAADVPGGKAIDIEPGKPMLVRDSKLRLSGEIKADENLARAEWGWTKAAAGSPLQKFAANSRPDFRFEEDVSLKPGRQTVYLRAKTANSEQAEVGLTIDYQPRLPEFVLETPDPDQVVYAEGWEAPEITLTGRLTLPPDPQPFQVTVKVNDLVVPHQIEGGKLTAKAKLQPRNNRIEVMLSNTWNASQMMERHVLYRRPPRVVAIKHTAPGKEPLTDLLAQMESPRDLNLTRIQLNGRDVPLGAATREKEENTITTWRLHLKDVPLAQGLNKLALSVANEDGESRVPGTLSISYEPPPPPKAKVEITSPAEKGTLVRTPQIEIKFQVQSESPLRRVQLVKGQQVLSNFDVSKVDKASESGYEYRGSAVARLDADTNLLRVVAVNAGGEEEARVTVSYLPMPVSMVVEEPPQQIKAGQVTLRGYITWQSESEDNLIESKLRRLRIYVNGHQQRPADIKPRTDGSRRRDFTAQVVLNRRQGNRISVEAPDLALEAGGRHQFVRDCENPQEPATLYLLIVGIGHKNGDDLTQLALKALQAQGDQELRTKVFHRVIKYSLTGHVNRGTVSFHLHVIRHFIETRGSPSDVVMVYWLGRATVDSGELWLPTSETRPGQRLVDTAISRQDLVGQRNDTPGARVLMLDAVSESSPQLLQGIVQDPTTRGAVLMHTWSKDTPIPGLLQALEEVSRRAGVSSDKGGRIALGEVEGLVEGLSKKKGVLHAQYRVGEEMRDLTLLVARQ